MPPRLISSLYRWPYIFFASAPTGYMPCRFRRQIRTADADVTMLRYFRFFDAAAFHAASCHFSLIPPDLLPPLPPLLPLMLILIR